MQSIDRRKLETGENTERITSNKTEYKKHTRYVQKEKQGCKGREKQSRAVTEEIKYNTFARIWLVMSGEVN